MLTPVSLPTSQRTVGRLDTTARDTTALSVIGAALLSAGRTLGAWSHRAAQRRALLELSDHQLADIGIDRETARREAAKFFWQA